MRAGLVSPLLRTMRPSLALGIIIGVSCVVVESCLIILIKHLANVHALSMIYLPGILLVAIVWGLGPAVACALVSALAVHYFLFPASSTELVVVPTFLAVAILISSIAALARSSAMEARERRRESDLAAEQAHFLLRVKDLRTALPETSHRLARALELPSATIEPEVVAADAGHTVFPLREGTTALGTLVVPKGLSRATLSRLNNRIVPSLEALLGAAREREAIGNALEASRDELRRIAEEQAALRRVATLVARGISSQELFSAVAGEMGRIVDSEYAAITRFEIDDTMTVVGFWNGRTEFDPVLRLGSRWPIRKGTASDLVLRNRRITLDRPVAGEIFEWARRRGLTSAVNCPIAVQGRLWGTMIALWASTAPQPDTEAHMRNFTELIATAIANAESLAELAASRARVVEATDEIRRRIERDLHDGMQQQLISLRLELSRAALAAPPGSEDLEKRLSQAEQGLADVSDNLREISRGLYPPILSVGGLEPAIKAIARRSAVPVELDLHGVRGLPERIEAAIYFIVSEALTNVTKHAHASMAEVHLETNGSTIELSIRDDGVGGCDPGHGSGLTGLKDRVAALDGEMTIVSAVGGGTTLRARLPFRPER